MSGLTVGYHGSHDFIQQRDRGILFRARLDCPVRIYRALIKPTKPWQREEVRRRRKDTVETQMKRSNQSSPENEQQNGERQKKSREVENRPRRLDQASMTGQVSADGYPGRAEKWRLRRQPLTPTLSSTQPLETPSSRRGKLDRGITVRRGIC
ncbi:unnamed protein product [Xylocopa violacea]|uniref:Uncharacterized protein n=1 Tax=Xylocopa violacea TaxID=135666 RepID=A0ABP1P0F2_XYLVO